MSTDRLGSIAGPNTSGAVSEDAAQMNSGPGTGRYNPAGTETPTDWGYLDRDPSADGSYVPQNAEPKPAGVATVAADEAGAVKDTAVAKVSEVTDTALDRGADVAEVAKEEISRVAGDAVNQFRSLWAQASDQLREQADASRHQLGELLNALSTELGEMASKSEQDGPLTALAKQGAFRGGQLSHWLTDSEASDVLAEIRGFARRRPFTFLAGAALAGVAVGRLSRGLMTSADHTSPAAVQAGQPATVGAGTTTPAVGAAYGAFPEAGQR